MSSPTHIEQYGNQLLILMDDGSRKLAYPTPTGELWLVTSAGGGPPDPGGARFIWPFGLEHVTSEFGPRDGPGSSYHLGMDFAYWGIEGDPIPCAADGTVIVRGTNPNAGLGYYLTVDHGTVEGVNLRTLYAHLQTPAVVGLGEAVVQGQNLGPVGNTGQSYGAHLHYETHVDGVHMNPREFMVLYEHA